jgi:hypothetical protein
MQFSLETDLENQSIYPDPKSPSIHAFSAFYRQEKIPSFLVTYNSTSSARSWYSDYCLDFYFKSVLPLWPERIGTTTHRCDYGSASTTATSPVDQECQNGTRSLMLCGGFRTGADGPAYVWFGNPNNMSWSGTLELDTLDHYYDAPVLSACCPGSLGLLSSDGVAASPSLIFVALIVMICSRIVLMF